MKNIILFLLLSTFIAHSHNNFTHKKPSTIVLANFNCCVANDDIKLEWTTFDEIDITDYIIEHSVNGLEYNEIATIDCQRNNTKSIYSFIHNSPNTECYNYYRIKLVDNKGNFMYSEIIDVYVEDKNNFDVTILNNPSITETINIAVAGAKDKDVEILVQDFSGHTIFSTMLNNSTGYTLKDNSILSGNYILTAQKGNVLIRKTIVIAK